jgi:hypothetical protein
MKDLKHIKRFNESEENLNISDVSDNTLNEKPAPSKSRLKKCEKGLHEFSETNYTEKTEVGTKKLWACNHCGTFMHNR